MLSKFTCIALTAACIVANVSAFAPVHSNQVKAFGVSLRASDGDGDDEGPVDPFDAYEMGKTTTCAIRVNTPGGGEPAKEGDAMTVAYRGRVMKTGMLFHETDLFLFKLGGENVMPGFSQGLIGVKEGSSITVKIPSELAYGSKGDRSGKIPPYSDLEFDLDVTEIKTGIAGELKLFGEVRAFGITACLAALAFTQYIEKAFSIKSL